MTGSAPNATHRVHGMGTELVAPTWRAITAGEADAVLGHFPTAGRIEALDWHSPRPFSAAALVRTTRGQFFLKRHHADMRSPEALAEEHLFMRHLGVAGVPVPEVMRADDGASALSADEWTYELHRGSHGLDLYRDRPSWTPFLTLAHAHAAGVALARLHEASRGFAAPARGPHVLMGSFSILPSADPLAAADTYVAARPALAAFLTGRAWRRQLARLFAALGEGLAARLADQASLWTHNDWHPSNLLWGGDGAVRTVFDFGLADRTCAVHDLATAIERSAVRWLELGQGRDDAIADPKAVRALLDGYATILPLSRAETSMIVRLLPLVHLEFALSEIDYFARLGEVGHAALAWETYLIGHAEWWRSAPGQDFLRQIDEGARC